MRRTLLVTITLLLSGLLSQANDSRIQALLEAGQQRLHQQQFHEAEAYFAKVLALDQDNPEAHYYLADCKRHCFRYAEALTLYQTAQRLSADSLPLAEYYVALMQKQTGAYRTAHQTFEDFIARHASTTNPKLREFVDQAQREIEGIKLVYALTLQPTQDFSFQSLPAPINSPSHDYAAQVVPYDSSLLISSTRSTAIGNAYDGRYGEHFSDLLLFKKKQRTWERQDDNLFTTINSAMNEGSGVFSPAGDQFYFTGCYQDSTCAILVSQFDEGVWSEPVPLSGQVNQINYNAKHPTLSEGGDTLYFTSDRPGGHGQFDLWMSIRDEGGWRTATNLGSAINTAGNEVSPEYYADEQALLFASDGRIGLGGYDLYVAHDLQQDRSTTVTNLGIPFNSSQDDLYMSVGRPRAFLTSNRGHEDGNFDVYTFLIQSSDIEAIAHRPLDSSVNWYELQLSSADLFHPEDRAFFEQLPLADKVKATHYVERQAFREAVSQQIESTDSSTYRYEALSTQDQTLVQRLARNKQKFAQKEFTEEVLPEDRHQYERLAVSEKQIINQLADQQWYAQLLQESTAPEEEAVYFYETLPAEEQQKIDRAVQKQQMLYQQSFTERPTLDDIFYYESLPLAEKNDIEQMVVVRQFMERVWDAIADPEVDYIYERLTSNEQQQIKRYITRQSFQMAQIESAVLSEETTLHYETLSSQEKASVRHLAKARKQFIMKEPIDDVSEKDRAFYEQLPLHEKEVVTRIIDAEVFSLLTSGETIAQDEGVVTFKKLPTQDQQRINQVLVRRKEFHQRVFSQLPSVDDVFAYQALSDQEKTSVRRLASTRQFTTHQPAATDPDQSAEVFYEKLPHSDQESVDRLVEHRKQFLFKGESTPLSLEDQYFLETLTTKEKQQVRKVVETRVFNELANEEMQTTHLTFQYQNLQGHERRRVDRLAQSRRFFSRVVEEDTSTLVDYFSFNKISERPSEQVDIEGQLSSLRPTHFPTHVFLVNDQQDTLATAPVDADGSFVFSKVDYRENYRVAFHQPARSFSQRPNYELATLSVVTQPELSRPARFGNVYFATDQHELPLSATSTLDSVVRFHRQHPGAIIEIRAFADSTGTKNYNLALTQRRAHSVQRYLAAQGIDPIYLSQVAVGAVTDGDLAFCRRVELSTGSVAAVPASPKTIYVIQAQPDLRQLAERYQVSLEQLLEWNGGKKQIAPYTPVRVVLTAD